MEKGIVNFNLIFGEYLAVSLPLMIAGLIDTLTLAFRLIYGLVIPDV